VPGEGPWIEIWLRIDSETVREAAYGTHGCPSSIASASVICQLAVGRTVMALSALDSHDLLVILGGLPEGKEEFADMAVDALRKALAID